jgi:hypothetical protein
VINGTKTKKKIQNGGLNQNGQNYVLIGQPLELIFYFLYILRDILLRKINAD